MRGEWRRAIRVVGALWLLLVLLNAAAQWLGVVGHGAVVLFSRAGCFHEIDTGHRIEQPISLCGLYPTWSPDGSRLAYINFLPNGRSDTVELYIAALPFDSTQPPIPLGHNGLSDFAPTWSPDGTQIALWEYQSRNNRWDILIMDVATADVSMTRAAGTFEVGYPTLAWSPDGNWLAFGAGRFSMGIELYIMEANTGLVRRLTDNAYRDDSPAWSPDSRRLVFTSAEDGYNRLYIIDIESGERYLLTDAAFGYVPAWSPDGRQIVFGSNHATSYTALYVINADGTGLHPLTPYLNVSALDEIEPAWMP